MAGRWDVPGKFMVLRGGNGAPTRLARHDRMYDTLRPAAERVLAAARKDPNPTYSAEVRMYRSARKIPGGKRSVRWNITLPPYLEMMARRVESKRGTMRRAARSA